MTNKTLLIVFLLLLLFLGGIWVAYYYFSVINTSELDEFNSDPTIIAQVGTEYLYLSDLNIYTDPVTKLNKESALEQLINESIILQVGAREGAISLTKEIFNSPEKNNEKRQNAVTQARELIIQKFTNNLKFEKLELIFNQNLKETNTQINNSKTIAFDILQTDLKDFNAADSLQDLASQLTTNSTISSNSDLSVNFTNEINYPNLTEDVSLPDSVYDFLYSTETNTISEIILLTKQNQTNLLDYAFAVFKLTDRVVGFKGLQAWLEDYKNSDQITIKIKS